jgi:alanyl aminopeptidase
MNEPENRVAMWQWLQQHYEAYRQRLPAFAQSKMPDSVSEGRCNGASADELSAFFAPRIKDLIGGERGLGQTLEDIRQCAALREHVGTKDLAGWSEAHTQGR